MAMRHNEQKTKTRWREWPSFDMLYSLALAILTGKNDGVHRARRQLLKMMILGRAEKAKSS
jgi:hypothetical protein